MVKSFADGSYEGRVLEWVPSVFIHTDKGGHYAKKGHHKVLGFFMVPQSQFHWIVEVIADDSGQWCGNDLRFDTKEEAEEYGNDLWRRWLSCKTYRTRFVDKEEQR
jgi:hypothetical protein